MQWPVGRGRWLAAMAEHQNWVKMHVETDVSTNVSTVRPVYAELPMMRFFEMVKANIDENKFGVFKSLVRTPLPTTAVTSVIFDRLSRIFEGRNPAFDYNFTSAKDRDNWENYRMEHLHEQDVWKTRGWEYYKTEPNSIVVVDLPAAGSERWDKSNNLPEPYFYWVIVDDIVDYRTDDMGNIVWLMFTNREKNKLYVVDDTYYRVFDYADSKPTDAEPIESAHNLGECPARFFIDTPVSLYMRDVKKSPITDILAELDWYLFFAISERHLEVYGSWPIYSGVAQACNYETMQTVNGESTHCHCQNGYLYDDGDNPMLVDGQIMKCPRCSKHKTAGAGTFVEYPMPNNSTDPEENIPDLRNPVQILTVDRHALQEVREKRLQRKNELIAYAVGIEGDAISTFSVSDKQIDAGFESQTTILIRVKNQFESVQKWADRIMIALRYGKDALESCSISYGTEFYATTTKDLRKLYKDAKESGASQADLAAIMHQIIETQYRNNPTQLQRMLILSDVEPLVGMSVAEATDYYEKGMCERWQLSVKLDFASFIKRFERENGGIIEYMGNDDYNEKIDTIINTLKQYTNEQN